MTDTRDVIADLVRVAGRRPAPPAADRDAVFAAASASWRAAVRSRRRRQTLWALAAGVAGLGIALLTFRLSGNSGLSSPVGTVASVRGELAILDPRSTQWRPLRDGDLLGRGATLRSGGADGALLVSGIGSIRLRSQTALVFEAPRHVSLKAGTVYVDTGGEPLPNEAPTDALTVASSLGVVRDIGTIFEVAATNESLRVRVRAGRVELGEVRGAPTVEAAAGEELRVRTNGAIERRSADVTGADWAWAERLATPFNPEGKPLAEFLRWVARETGRRLRFRSADDELLARKAVLHGSARNLPPLEALELMMAATDFEYALQPDSVLVVGRRSSSP